jgi:hypothetical protein
MTNKRWSRSRASRCGALLLCSGAIGTLAGSASLAEASDSKWFPGTFCRAAPAPGYHHLPHYLTNGSVTNRHTTQFLRVVCPLVRDNTQNTSGPDSVAIGWFNLNTDHDISCTLFSMGNDGTTEWEEEATEGSTTTEWEKKNVNMSTSSSAIDGSYHLTCLIPPQHTLGLSGIAYFRVQEP